MQKRVIVVSYKHGRKLPLLFPISPYKEDGRLKTLYYMEKVKMTKITRTFDRVRVTYSIIDSENLGMPQVVSFISDGRR